MTAQNGKVSFNFDDGWQDNYEPVLAEVRRRATPITIFVCSDLTGTQSPFWPERVQCALAGSGDAECERTIAGLKTLAKAERGPAIERLIAQQSNGNKPGDNSADTTMNWETLASLTRAGVDIESHGRSHEILLE